MTQQTLSIPTQNELIKFAADSYAFYTARAFEESTLFNRIFCAIVSSPLNIAVQIFHAIAYSRDEEYRSLVDKKVIEYKEKGDRFHLARSLHKFIKADEAYRNITREAAEEERSDPIGLTDKALADRIKHEKVKVKYYESIRLVAGEMSKAERSVFEEAKSALTSAASKNAAMQEIKDKLGEKKISLLFARGTEKRLQLVNERLAIIQNSLGKPQTPPQVTATLQKEQEKLLAERETLAQGEALAKDGKIEVSAGNQSLQRGRFGWKTAVFGPVLITAAASAAYAWSSAERYQYIQDLYTAHVKPHLDRAGSYCPKMSDAQALYDSTKRVLVPYMTTAWEKTAALRDLTLEYNPFKAQE